MDTLTFLVWILSIGTINFIAILTTKTLLHLKQQTAIKPLELAIQGILEKLTKQDEVISNLTTRNLR